MDPTFFRAIVISVVLSMEGCVLLSSCTSKADLTVWKADYPAPDGSYIATADTVQNGGLGSGGIETSVYVAQTGHSDQITQIVGFSCDGPISRPYVLDNVANAGGGIDLAVNWITPTHLDVTYRGRGEAFFQAVKFGKITITLENLADSGTNSKPGETGS